MFAFRVQQGIDISLPIKLVDFLVSKNTFFPKVQFKRHSRGRGDASSADVHGRLFGPPLS